MQEQVATDSTCTVWRRLAGYCDGASRSQEPISMLLLSWPLTVFSSGMFDAASPALAEMRDVVWW